MSATRRKTCDRGSERVLGKHPVLPGFSVIESGHAAVAVQEGDALQGGLVESVWDCSGRRKGGGWGGETAGMFWPAV